MDYYSMKRKELQALCKEHNIPANSANSVLADKLSELLNEKKKPVTRQRSCMKSSGETMDESEPSVSRRQAKKVRFSPNNDLVESKLRSGKKQEDMDTEMKGRRKSVAKKVDKAGVDNDDAVQIPVKITRSAVQILGNDDVVPTNEKKQGRKVIKDIEKGTGAVKKTDGNIGRVTRLKAHTSGKGGVQLDESKGSKRAVKDVLKASESVGETVVGRVRVTRSKAQTLMEDDIGSDLDPQVKKKSGRRVAKDSENPEPSKEITDVPVRATRSRGQTSKNDVIASSQADKKRTRRDTVVVDLSNQESPKRKSLRSRALETANEDESEELGHVKRKKRSEKRITKVPESQHHGLRQSRRNKAKGEDSTVLNQNVSKLKMVKDKITRSKATKSSGGNSKSKDENNVKVQRKSKIVQQLEEPLEHAGRKNVNGRKSVLQPENTEDVVEEPVTRSARSRKAVPENETKTVASATASQKSRKRSGAMIKANSSKKKAKLSGMKQIVSEDNAEKFNRKGTPISKLGKLELDEKVIEAEHTPVVDESGRRFTRGAIRSDRKAVGNFSSRKVAKFKPDPAINTAPGRFTRSGFKQGGSVITKLSEKKVDKRKHSSQSAYQRQAIDDAQMTSPNPDVTSSSVEKIISANTIIAVQSVISEDAKDQILEHSADLLALESDTLPTELVEETRVFTCEPATVMENVSSVSGEIVSGVESHTISKYETGATLDLTENLPNSEDETPSVTNLSDAKMTPFSVAEVVGTMPNAILDGTYVQNEDQQVNLNSELFGEDETSVPVSAEKEMEMTESGLKSNELQIDAMVEEPVVSVGKTVVMEESVGIAIGVTCKGNDGDADISRDLVSYEAVTHESFEHSNAKSKLKEMEAPLEPSMTEGVTQVIADDGAQIEKGSAYKGLPPSPVGRHEVADNVEHNDEDENKSTNEPNKDDTDGVDVKEIDSYDVEHNKDDMMEQSTGDDKLHDLKMDQNDIKDDIITGNDAPEIPNLGNSNGEDVSVDAMKEFETDLTPLTDDNTNKDDTIEQPTGDDKLHGLEMDENDIKDDIIAGNDGLEIPVFGNSGRENESVNATKEYETADNVFEDPVLIKTVDKDRRDTIEQLTSNDNPAIHERDVGGDEPMPAQNEKIPEVLFRVSEQEPYAIAADDRCDTVEHTDSPNGNHNIVTSVDDLEKSMININKDGISDNLGDADEPESTVGVDEDRCDAIEQSDSLRENDDIVTRVDCMEESINIIKDGVSDNLGETGVTDTKNEIKILGETELDERFQSKESESIFGDINNEQRTENDPALMVDDDLDGDKLMEDCSNDDIDENPTTREESSPIAYTKEEPPDELMVDTGTNGSPITEESLPNPYKKEESPIGESVSDPPTSFKDHDSAKQEQTVDWGSYSFGMDESEKAVTEGLQTPDRANSSIEERSTPAADLVNSVTNLENASINVAYGKSNQDVNTMNQNANADVAEEFFNWSESSLKGLFTTPAAIRIDHLKDGQEGAVSFSFPDEHIGRNDNASNDFDHQWENAPSGAFTDKTQGDANLDPGQSEDPKEKMYGGPNSYFSHTYFDDDDEAGTSHHDASGVKDISICSGEFENKEETKPKDSQTGDNSASD